MITELSQEEKRVKIAEAFGWTAKEDEEGYWRAVSPNGVFAHDLWMSERNVWHSGIPNYFIDLNACHEMEKAGELRLKFFDYVINLAIICGIRPNGLMEPYGNCACAVTATAAQRAEAFGKTLKLW